MGSKSKNVDSIEKPAAEKAADSQLSNGEPLLSIIEPVEAKTKDKIQKPKKDKKLKLPVALSGTKPARAEAHSGGGPSLDSSVQPQNDGKKPPLLKRHHKIIMASCGALAFLLVLTGLVGGGMYAQQAMYENKIFPGVVVWGEDVSGKSVSEVQQLISDKIKTYSVTLKGPDQDYEAKADDLGLVFNSESMALGAYSRGRSSSAFDNYVTRARLLATKIAWKPWQNLIRANDLVISPSFIVNEDKFNLYVNKVVDNIKITAQDSQVNVVGGQVQLKPAIYGRDVKVDSLKKQVKDSLNGFNSGEIPVETVVVKPAIIDDAAQDVMIQAQSVMKRPVVLTYQEQEFRPNQETVVSWISFVKNPGDTKYTLVIDKSKMKSYFDYLGTKINIYPVSRKVRVENGVKETEITPGANGTLVDTALLGTSIAAALPIQASVSLTIPTYVAQFKTTYENVVIADWDKYIDINLTTQTMIACEKGGVNCHQWSVTTGNDSHATPTGTFLVLGRNANFYMTGGTPGIDYYKVWVDHATWFTSAGHAIHDAHWRNGSFGGQDYHYDGSHGCVNSPDEAAIFVYNWAPVGTPVIVHY